MAEPPHNSIVSFLSAATQKVEVADSHKRFLLTISDGSTRYYCLVKEAVWKWIFRHFPEDCADIGEEPVPLLVQAEMRLHTDVVFATVQISRERFMLERALLAPGILFTSAGAVAAYVAEYGLVVEGEQFFSA